MTLIKIRISWSFPLSLMISMPSFTITMLLALPKIWTSLFHFTIKRWILPRFCHVIVWEISCGGNINLFGQIRTGNNLIWIIKTRDVTIFRMILGFPVQTNSRFVKSKTLQPVPQFMFYLFSSISPNDLFNELILWSTSSELVLSWIYC